MGKWCGLQGNTRTRFQTGGHFIIYRERSRVNGEVNCILPVRLGGVSNKSYATNLSVYSLLDL